MNRILQVAKASTGGGGEQISLRLHDAFRSRGLQSYLAVGRGPDRPAEEIIAIPDRWEISGRAKSIQRLYQRLMILSRHRGATRLFALAEALAFPRVAWDLWYGMEDYTQPGSANLAGLIPNPPDVLLLHNLHADWRRREGFFDLRQLQKLGARWPVILAPQDPWLLTGHCAHPIDCPRWRIGCGRCPDLKIYPSVRRDATAANWKRKRAIYAGSDLYLAAPSGWLLNMFAESGIRFSGTRLIPNGVDTALFAPGGQSGARGALGLPLDRKIVLVSGNRLRTNPWKGFAWIEETSERLAFSKNPWPVDFLCIGEEGETIVQGGSRIVFAGGVQDPARMAQYYLAADVYFHPSRADTAPFSVLEAMSSGLPVVATTVGGIPEQVAEGDSGFLVAPGDTRAMAERLLTLLADADLAREMGAEGRRRVVAGFDFSDQVSSYVDWMREIAADFRTSALPQGGTPSI